MQCVKIDGLPINLFAFATVTILGVCIFPDNHGSFFFLHFLHGTTMTTQLLHHFGNDLGTLLFPFGAISLGIIQVFVTRLAKDATILELSGQGNNVLS